MAGTMATGTLALVTGEPAIAASWSGTLTNTASNHGSETKPIGDYSLWNTYNMGGAPRTSEIIAITCGENWGFLGSYETVNAGHLGPVGVGLSVQSVEQCWKLRAWTPGSSTPTTFSGQIYST